MNEISRTKIPKVEGFIFYFLCGFSFSLPLSKAAGNIFLALSLLAFAYRIFLRRDDLAGIFHEYKKYLKVIAIFLAAIFISALGSEKPLSGVGIFSERYFAHASIIVPLFFVCRDKWQILRLAKFLLAGLIISNLTVIVQAVPRLSEETWRFGGVLSPMIQGSVLAMFLPIYVLLFIFAKSPKWKLGAFLAVLLGVATILLTGTRGAWLAVVILIPLVILIYSSKRLKHIGMILVFLSIIGGLIFATPALLHRVQTITDMHMQSNSERLLIWKSALQMFKDHPILGVGYGGYASAYQEQYISPQAKERTLTHAHNNFVQMLAENGIVGFGALIFMLVYFSWFAVRGWAREKNIAYVMCFCILWGMMLHGLTEYNLETSVPSKLFWYSLGLCLAYCRVGGEEKISSTTLDKGRGAEN